MTADPDARAKPGGAAEGTATFTFAGRQTGETKLNNSQQRQLFSANCRLPHDLDLSLQDCLLTQPKPINKHKRNTIRKPSGCLEHRKSPGTALFPLYLQAACLVRYSPLALLSSEYAELHQCHALTVSCTTRLSDQCPSTLHWLLHQVLLPFRPAQAISPKNSGTCALHSHLSPSHNSHT
jgi:hypothetical protein